MTTPIIPDIVPVGINPARLTDNYFTAMAYAAWKNDLHTQQGVLTIFLRGQPEKVSYTTQFGLGYVLKALERWKYTPEIIERMRHNKHPDGTRKWPEAFLEWMGGLHLQVKVECARDGQILYPGPVARVSGPLCLIDRLETFMTNDLRLYSDGATKMTRAAYVRDSFHRITGKYVPIIDGSPRRANDPSGLFTSWSFLVCGADVTSLEAIEDIDDDVQSGGTMAHIWMMRFPWQGSSNATELAAFRAWADAFPNFSAFLVDTINPYSGIENAITVLKEMKAAGNGKGYKLRIDSGDLRRLSIHCRKRLDEEGLTDVGVMPTGGLRSVTAAALLNPLDPAAVDALMFGEYLKHRCEQGTPFEMSVNLEFVGKLSTVLAENGTWVGRQKLSGTLAKNSQPGNLDRWRMLSPAGTTMDGDITVDLLAAPAFEPIGSVVLGSPAFRLLEPITSCRRKPQEDGTVENLDKVFPAGTVFVRPMELEFADGKLVDESRWSRVALTAYHKAIMAGIRQDCMRVDGTASAYGVGFEAGLFGRMSKLAAASEFSTEAL